MKDKLCVTLHSYPKADKTKKKKHEQGSPEAVQPAIKCCLVIMKAPVIQENNFSKSYF